MLRAAYDKTVLADLSSFVLDAELTPVRHQEPKRRLRSNSTESMNVALNHPLDLTKTRACRLWIDGVGAWMLWFNDQLDMGNGFPDEASDRRLRIFADLRTRHVTWKRLSGGDQLTPLASTKVNGRTIAQESYLRSGDKIQLGDDVTMSYEVPSTLCPSAVLQLEGGYRFASLDDGVVLFSGTCLMGPGSSHHIPCSAWSQTLVLFDRNGSLMWKVQGESAPAQNVCRGAVLEGDDWRVRIEAVD